MDIGHGQGHGHGHEKIENNASNEVYYPSFDTKENGMPIPAQKFREIVFQMLYSYDMGRASDENMVNLLTQELAVTKKVVKEAQLRVHQIRSHIAEIDQMIASTSHSYNFERIQSVERNVLRLGTYELLFEKTVPFKVVMAEALRLARKFGSKEAGTFVNAVLEALYQTSLGQPIDREKIKLSAEELAEIEKISQQASLQPKKETDKEPADE